jgi:asparagine synthase (glutamine-hydrolysing)
MIISCWFNKKRKYQVNSLPGSLLNVANKATEKVFDLNPLIIDIKFKNSLPFNYCYHEMTFTSSNIKVFFIGEKLIEISELKERTSNLISTNRFSKNDFTDFIEINGAWLMLFVDVKENTLKVLRDPIGLFNVYFTENEDEIIFSSSLIKLRDLCGIDKISKYSIFSFLHFMYIPAPQTIYEKIFSLEPGKSIIFFDNSLTTIDSAKNRFFEREVISTTEAPGLDDYIKKFEELLICSIEKRIAKGRGKAGIFLSGGKDSSSIAIAASKINPEKFTCINIGFKNQKHDESNDAKIVSKHLGLEFEKYIFSDAEYHEGFKNFIATHEQPFLDISGLPVTMAGEILDKKFDTYLDGTGNDYYLGIKPSKKQTISYNIKKYRTLSIVKDLLKKGKPFKKIQKLIPDYPEVFKSWDGWSEDEANTLMGSNFDLQNISFYEVAEKEFSKSAMHIKTSLIAKIWEPHCAFQKAFRNIYKNENTVSFPFTDNEFVSFFSKNPFYLSHTKSENKVLIRKYLALNLPENIVSKKKGSFVFDSHSFLTHKNNLLINEYLTADKLIELGIADIKRVNDMIKSFNLGQSDLYRKILALVTLSVWYQTVHKRLL